MGSYDLYKQMQANEPKPKRFFTLSMILHGLLVVGFFAASIPVVEKLKNSEEVAFDFGQSGEAEGVEIAEGSEEVSGGTGAALAYDNNETNNNNEKEAAATASTTDSVVDMTATENNSVAQIDVPTVAKAKPVAPAKIETTIQKLQQEHHEQLATEQLALEQATAEAEIAEKELIAETKKQIEADKVQLQNNLKEIQAKNAAALAAAKSVEQQDKIEKAAVLTPTPALPSAATSATEGGAAVAESTNANDADATTGAGSAAVMNAGSQGHSAAGTTSSSGDHPAATGKIRTVGELHQKSGNRKPEYSLEERLRGEKGLVVFHAYVTQEGKPIDFKMIQSSGFRNLDKKALVALKAWKFESGQEGWVELPFHWDLKGEAEEMPTTLRRIND